MLTYFPSAQALHAPETEFFRGERVPCFESPARAGFVREALLARGLVLREPDTDSRDVLAQVHDAALSAVSADGLGQWLALDPATPSASPFPSVWPVRTLRSDVEPHNFTARLGLYSMDNGSPLSAGTWAAAKAGADAAASAAAQAGRRGRPQRSSAPPARPGTTPARLHGRLLFPQQRRRRGAGAAQWRLHNAWPSSTSTTTTAMARRAIF
jgi:acetoin utilization deacetylase AcuC-like enzyme